MKDYIICMDVSGDITIDAAKKMNLVFLQMDYSLGSEMKTLSTILDYDGIKAFYDGQRNGDLTKTTQITPFLFEEYLSKYMEEGKSVLYLGLSKGLSKTYESALLAKESLKESYPDSDLYVVDTRSATGGLGVLVERAYRNKEKGMSIVENFNDLNDIASRIKHFFMVQDLMYLKRGGRISATAATFATVLNIKPILKINQEGKLETVSKKRGNKGALKELFETFKNDVDLESNDVVYIIDADASNESEFLMNKVNEFFPTITIRKSSLNPIIGAHTGPGMVAICYIGKK